MLSSHPGTALAHAASPGRLLSPARRIVPFVGRTTELASLLDWCDGPEPAAARLISGPRGVGKTRLAREAAHEMAHAGWTCLDLPDGAEPAALRRRPRRRPRTPRRRRRRHPRPGARGPAARGRTGPERRAPDPAGRARRRPVVQPAHDDGPGGPGAARAGAGRGRPRRRGAPGPGGRAARDGIRGAVRAGPRRRGAPGRRRVGAGRRSPDARPAGGGALRRHARRRRGSRRARCPSTCPTPSTSCSSTSAGPGSARPRRPGLLGEAGLTPEAMDGVVAAATAHRRAHARRGGEPRAPRRRRRAGRAAGRGGRRRPVAARPGPAPGAARPAGRPAPAGRAHGQPRSLLGACLAGAARRRPGRAALRMAGIVVERLDGRSEDLSAALDQLGAAVAALPEDHDTAAFGLRGAPAPVARARRAARRAHAAHAGRHARRRPRAPRRGAARRRRSAR